MVFGMIGKSTSIFFKNKLHYNILNDITIAIKK